MGGQASSGGEGECVAAWPVAAVLTPSLAARSAVNVRGRLRTSWAFNGKSILVTGVGAGTHDTTCDGLASEGAPHQGLSGHLCDASKISPAGYGEA
jgi:hypothetical protein